ncbi:MAG: glycosyl-4,4'-diaponeurosporenoate acyltransferase [Monoglobales bacterium]
MNGLVRCIAYLAVVGVVFFLLGRALPPKWFRYDAVPFRSFYFEKSGTFYKTFGVQKWKDKFPDMSIILPALLPSKKLPKKKSVEQIELMLQETCIAELIHSLLCVAGFGCIFLWQGAGGIIISILYMLGNIPYNMIQRYNRPKLVRILKNLQEKGRENRKEGQKITNEKCSDIELQYGART